MVRPTVLVVEDDEEMRDLLLDELWNEGYRLRGAKDGVEALFAVEQVQPDLIITDLRMPAGGMQYIGRLRLLAPKCPIIVMTAFGDEKLKQEVLAAGGTAYVNKPVHLSELKLRVRELLPPIVHA